MRSEFISYYEHEGQEGFLEIEMCPVCKYVYKKFTPNADRWESKILKGSVPFIEFLECEMSDSEDYYDKVRKHTKYACPRCGVIQLAVSGEWKDEDEQNR